jgi:hypothetical protein
VNGSLNVGSALVVSAMIEEQALAEIVQTLTVDHGCPITPTADAVLWS